MGLCHVQSGMRVCYNKRQYVPYANAGLLQLSLQLPKVANTVAWRALKSMSCNKNRLDFVANLSQIRHLIIPSL
jgi:hypothetical protein